MVDYTKESGTATSNSAVVTGYEASKISDASNSTLWFSNEATTDVTKAVIGYLLPAAKPVTKIEVNIYNWGHTLVVLYADSFPALVSGYTVARTIDTRVSPNDDLGVPWARQGTNTILLDGTVSAKAWAITTTTAATGVFSASANGRIGVNEMAVYTTTPAALEYTKANGTIFAKDTYIGEGSLANLVDGNLTTLWHGLNANESSPADFFGFSFATTQIIRKLEINFSRWGKTIGVGIADSIPATKAGLTSIRLIDTKVTPNDDLGVPWTRTGKNTILLPMSAGSKVIAIYSNDNLGGPLSENGMNGNNTRETVFEFAAFTSNELPPPTDPVPSNFTQVNGTAFATSVFDNNNAYRIAYLNNGTTNTYWASGNTANGQKSEDQTCGIAFAADTAVHRVVVHLDYWGKEIVFGYGPAASGVKTDFTVIRRIDTRNVLVDDLGVAIGVGKNLTFNIPLYPRAKALAMFMDTPAKTGIVDMGANDYAQVREITMYSDLGFPEYKPPQPYVPAPNPKLPVVAIPVAPFVADVLSWTRKEYNVAGAGLFTPAADTTLVLAVLQGAGSAGYIETDLDGNTTALGSYLFGESSRIYNAEGTLLEAGGGGQNSAALSHLGGDLLTSIASGTPSDWIQSVDLQSTDALAPILHSAARVGATTKLGTIGGTTFTLANINANGALQQTTLFTGTAPLVGIDVAASSNFTRNSSQGFVVTGAGTGFGTAYIEFTPIRMVAGQTLTLNYQKVSNDVTAVYMNDVLFGSVGSTSGGSFTFTCPATGMYRLKYVKGASNSGGHYSNITGITIGGYGLTRHAAGGAGRTAYAYMLPQTLYFKVGAGGTPIAGGQTIPAAAHGTRGSGGASGGKGGDGVIIFYEFKGPLPSQPLTPPLFTNYNVSAEPSGTYRTAYVGLTPNAISSYTHKLRPRTKSVIAMVVGPGGGRTTVSSGGTSSYAKASKLSTALFSVQANGGGNFANFNGGVSGGNVISDTALLYSNNGTFSGYGSGVVASAGILGGYGDGAPGVNGGYGGSAGGVALVSIGENYFGAGRTLNVEAGGPGLAGWENGKAGIVYIFESELSYGVLTSQVAELILQNTGLAPTQTSQVAELILQNTGLAPTQTSQVAELVLLENAPYANTQITQVAMLVLSRSPKVASSVSNSILEVVTRADPGKARVSLSAQSVLVGSERAVINTSQTAQLLLIREDPTNIEFMDFGVVRYPMKNELYLSDVCTIASVGSGVIVRIQLEGFLPLGSTLIINGVEIGSLTALVQDGDRVQLKSGITNFFDQRLILYAYTTRGNQIIRDHAGYWTMLQADLSPRKRAIIGAVTKYLGMKSAMAGAKLVSVTALKQAGIGAKAALTMMKDAGLSVLSIKQTAQKAVASDTKSDTNVFRPDQVGSAVWDTGIVIRNNAYAEMFASAGTQVAKADVVLSVTKTFAPFKANYAKSASLGWDINETNSVRDYQTTAVKAKAGSSPLTDILFTWNYHPGAELTGTAYNKIGANGFVPADMNFVMFDYAKSTAFKLVDFISGYPQTGTFFRPGYVYSPGYVPITSDPISFTTQENDKIALVAQQYKLNTSHHYEYVDHNYLWRSSPNREVGLVITAIAAVWPNRVLWGGLGFTGVHAPNYNTSETEWIKRENPVTPGRDRVFMRQEYNRASGLTQSYAKRGQNVNLIPVQYRVRKANIQLYGMKAILYQAGKNRIDKAKFYMGFTTKAEVDAFVINFLKPTSKVALDGYVYRVGVDETLVCEIRGPNMPVAWLMHGG